MTAKKAPAYTPPKDEVGDRLIALGYAPNVHILDLNGTISPPADMTLSWPWNLPSRPLRHPIAVSALPKDGGPRWLALTHPALAAHPLVARIEGELGVKIRSAPPEGEGHRFDLAPWWHAADLINRKHWRDLLKTREFTSDDRLAQAVGHGLSSKGQLTLKAAREIMGAIGAPEPYVPGGFLALFISPPALKKRGQTDWPNAHYGVDAVAKSWATIVGIEQGWFDYSRGGYLEWTQAGRDRHAAGDAPVYVEKATGQLSFAF